MSEEQIQEQPKPAPENTNEGNNPSTLSIIERADNIVKRLEEAEKRIDDKTKAYEQILSRSMLSGKAVITEPVKIEESPKDYAQKVMSGSIKYK